MGLDVDSLVIDAEYRFGVGAKSFTHTPSADADFMWLAYYGWNTGPGPTNTAITGLTAISYGGINMKSGTGVTELIDQGYHGAGLLRPYTAQSILLGKENIPEGGATVAWNNCWNANSWVNIISGKMESNTTPTLVNAQYRNNESVVTPHFTIDTEDENATLMAQIWMGAIATARDNTVNIQSYGLDGGQLHKWRESEPSTGSRDFGFTTAFYAHHGVTLGLVDSGDSASGSGSGCLPALFPPLGG